jgi:hypothetical protein
MAIRGDSTSTHPALGRPELIFTGSRLQPAEQAPGDSAMIAGQLKLPDSLPAGDYSVELVIEDQLAAGKDHETSQWGAFTLVQK